MHEYLGEIENEDGAIMAVIVEYDVTPGRPSYSDPIRGIYEPEEHPEAIVNAVYEVQDLGAYGTIKHELDMGDDIVSEYLDEIEEKLVEEAQ